MPALFGWAAFGVSVGMAVKVRKTRFPRLAPLAPSFKLMVAPDPAARVNAAVEVNVKVPPEPGVALIVDAPPMLPVPSVIDATVWFVFVAGTLLPVMVKVPPFKDNDAVAGTRLLLLTAVLSSWSVPPF